jgi:DtxR family Mn-dependent transcriptional regulator
MNHDVWKSFAANEISHSMAHYLTTIHELRENRGYARVSDVARDLDVTKGSVSVQVKHLKEKGLVTEDENRFLTLTPLGESLAKDVGSNRQVLIQFIQKVLGICPEQAETDACKMEHLLSRETSSKILALVELLQSDDPDAKKLLRKLQHFQFRCPSLEECQLCDDQCLVEVEPCRRRQGASS